MIKKGFWKRALCITLLTALSVGCFAGCGKKDKKKEDSIIQQASTTNKDYVFKCEELEIDGVDTTMVGYMYLVGDRVFCTMNNYSNGVTSIASFNTDGSNGKTINVDIGKDDWLYDYVFNEDGSFYAIYGHGSGGDEQEGVASAGDDDLEESEEKTDEASKGASAEEDKDASKDDAKDDKDAKDKDSKDKDSKKVAAGEESSDSASDSASEGASDEAAEGSSEESEESGPGIFSNYDDVEYSFAKFDADGKMVNKIPFGHGEYGDEDYYSINSLSPYKDGMVLISSTKGVEIYSEADGFKTILDTQKEGSPYQGKDFYFQKGFDNKYFAQSYGENGETMNIFDPEKLSFSDDCKAFKEKFGFSGYMLFGGNGYDIYISDNSGIYGYDAAKDEIVKLLDYVDSDIEAYYGLSSVVALSDTEFIAAIPGLESDYTLCRLTKVPADQVKERKIITFGGSYVDYNIRRAITEFNKDNDEYKIKIVDYSSYNTEDNYSAGEEKFDMDIVSGDVPDIMYFAPDSPIEKYEGKGVFLDCKPYFDKDEDLKNVEFLPNILNAMMSGDKMYTLIPSFSVSTLVMDQKLAGGKNTITFDEADELIKQNNVGYDTAYGYLDKGTILGYGILFAGDKYIDWDNKKCNFNSDEFVKLLEYANNFVDEVNWENIEGSEDELYPSKKALFQHRDIAGFREYQVCKQAVFCNDVSFVGFPNNEGINESIIYPSSIIAISSHSQNPEAAWAFVKTLFADKYQTQPSYDFAVTKAGLKARSELALDRPYYEIDGKKEYYDDYYYMGDSEVKLKPLTQEEVDYLLEFVQSVDKVYKYNKSVQNIITEEAAAYFSGQKSAKEVANVIQSRLSIYVNENS